MTNEKRGGLTVILFDRSRFQLFTLKFSNKFVQSSSCERPKTAQRTLFFFIWNQQLFPNSRIASELYEKIRETCMPHGEFKRRYWFRADTPNIARNCSVTWKDSLWSSDSYRLLKYRGGWTIPMFQLSEWCEKCVGCRYLQTIIDLKWQKQGSLSCFRPLRGCGLYQFVWKSQREQLKGRPIECYYSTSNPVPTHLFSHWSQPLP